MTTYYTILNFGLQYIKHDACYTIIFSKKDIISIFHSFLGVIFQIYGFKFCESLPVVKEEEIK